uniref:Uncharacterized protein n=1 Tax=Arundo donax TaxID=35708 RepID=A0A0A8ZX27_ARUDO
MQVSGYGHKKAFTCTKAVTERKCACVRVCIMACTHVDM